MEGDLQKKWKTTSKKMENDLKKNEGQPQKKWKMTLSTIKKINLNWL